MENNNKKFSLSKRERFGIMWRSQFLQGSWNYERMQNLGFLYAILPALKKFYPAGSDEAKDALKRHMEFFNCHPYPTAPIIGVTLALEEEKANGVDVDAAAINGVKVGMMGPLAGVGDPVFWFTVRPIVGAIAASLAVSGSIIGPLFFFIVWNAIRLAFLWYTQEFAYKQGTAITSDLGGGLLQKLTKGASILGMFILGVLIQRWVNVNLAGPNAMLPKQPLADGAYNGQWITHAHNIGTVGNPVWAATAHSEIVNQGTSGAHFAAISNLGALKNIDGSTLISTLQQAASGLGMNPFKQQSLNEVFNSLIPGFVALILTFIVIWIFRKWKNRNAPLVIIICLFILGILLHVVGLA
ncbi:PTS system mannose/fructose/sorbose family transporter subunit IID [Lactococcus sp. NH2-7C]|uniref:PTS system mannose/fructose/sorbose family transporter subunit IID n=1 Tax=Lactococcus TaxID=1357 RepID=UPI001CDC73E9|nr:PTS system mannose/fructose/sorbose family transporter subunit IID [Lactococcus sp. NH2-7C]MCA2390920.1 PTS system mannose/fructose/sorbose family transporter subunit IID [Lactococcus sp. NH2-7C]WGV29729.1 PTS system mannose/fructose/sorbose family transporter subunit IID [Lactococcus sp. NH2-7C]